MRGIRTALIAAMLTGAAMGHAAAQEPAAPDASFADWLVGFRAEAAAAGISAATLDAAFAGIQPSERVLELNDNQPEFSRSIWDYLDSAVSETRVANGRARFGEQGSLLADIEAAYGVDAETIVAIWGLESSYGAIMGDHDAIAALATFAWKGRRTAFGREQLLGALRIIENGYASRAELKGSWAGAMGHTQFIPTTYLAYAVDRDGDGRRDIWGNLGDVFASTANYLSYSGFRQDEPWGVEITLPDGFDYGLAAVSTKKPLAEWAALGVIGAKGELIGRFDPNLPGRILLPSGAKGPAFLVFRNFEAILKYNRSTSYALAVSLLGESVARRDASIRQPWPRDDRPLSLTERKRLQEALAEKGFDPGPADGILGANTRRALREWQASQGLPADGYANAEILLKLTTS